MKFESFRHISHWAVEKVGSPISFSIAVTIVLIWALTGPIYNYSDTWQLVINTGTTIATFLLMFLLQYSQNRDAKALHLKLDELLLSHKDACKQLIDIEDGTDEEIEESDKKYRHIREETHKVMITNVCEGERNK